MMQGSHLKRRVRLERGSWGGRKAFPFQGLLKKGEKGGKLQIGTEDK